MIISNAVPKAGGHLLFAFLGACGLVAEPGELYADVDVNEYGTIIRRDVGGSTKDIWGDTPVRSVEEMLADRRRDRVVNAHVHDFIDLSQHRVAFIYRHPRNLLVSAARFSAAGFDWTPPAPEPDLHAVRAVMTMPYIRQVLARCQCFIGWRKKALVSVRFEDLVGQPIETARVIAAELGIAPVDPTTVFGDATPWITRKYRGTWSGQLSDWTAVWTEAVDTIWRDLGGVEVERLYGYA